MPRSSPRLATNGAAGFRRAGEFQGAYQLLFFEVQMPAEVIGLVVQRFSEHCRLPLNSEQAWAHVLYFPFCEFTVIVHAVGNASMTQKSSLAFEGLSPSEENSLIIYLNISTPLRLHLSYKAVEYAVDI